MAKKKPNFAALLEDENSPPSDPFAQPAEAVLQPGPLEGIVVPNTFPRLGNQPYRIALIGEAPSFDETEWQTCDQGHEFCRIQKIPPRYDTFTRTSCPTCYSTVFRSTPKPFVGMSGRELTRLLGNAGILRDACFLGNVSQHRPPGNDISLFALDGAEITTGLEQLKRDLADFKPHLCVLLGRTALWAANGQTSISDWRGSVFWSDNLNCKCLPSYHPAACLRNYEWTPQLYLDLRKARQEGVTPHYSPTQRNYEINLSAEQIAERLYALQDTKPTIALDIEGYVDRMSCLSVAPSGTEAFIVPFTRRGGGNYWATDEEEFIVWKALAAVMADHTVPKVLQNSLYDRFVLQYSYGLIVHGVKDDTMLKHWEQYCEMEKSLGFQCSIYTDQPFYKQDRKSDSLETFWRYCCTDSAVTWEINSKLDKWLSGGSLAHYRLNVALLNPLLYMELRGISYNSALAKTRLEQVQSDVVTLQTELDTIAGCGFDPHIPRDLLRAKVQEAMCYKRNPSQPKKDYEDVYPKIDRMLSTGALTKTDLCYIAVECGMSMNIKSAAFKTFLYEKLNLPKQYKKDPNTGEERISTDYESLLRLQKVSPHRAVELAIDIAALRTRGQMLEISEDRDGRIRCGYNIVGTETGRLTCYTSPTGSGYNLQTIPSIDTTKPEGHPLRQGMRDLFVADPNCWMFQCDLSGADGWTVGAHLNSIGDPTMLLDLRGKIKPAAAICYMLRHGNHSLVGKTREEIKVMLKDVKGDDWDYFACKQGIWGTCYLMGPDKLATVIAKNSEGKIWLSRSQVKDFQEAVFTRYKVKLWHSAMSRKLSANPELTSASGFKRRFFGRSTEILGQALAHEPQANTTYATNLAMYRLWTDSENRTTTNDLGTTIWQSPTKLKIEPLHQVHDALLGQFRKEDTAWAIAKIKSYFANEIIIAGQKITIPFEGNYGESWGNLKEGVI